MSSGFSFVRLAENNFKVSSRQKLALVSSLAVAIAGCSGNGWMGSKGSAASNLAQDSRAASSESQVELARRSLFSSTTNTAGLNGASSYGLELVEKETTSEIKIAMPSGSVSKPQVTTLDSPYRVVLDIEGVSGPKSSTIDTPESLYVSRVRVGAHPDKSRIVLDMNDSEGIIPTLLEDSNGNYTLKLAKAGATAPAVEVAANSFETESVTAPTSSKISQTAKALEFDDAGLPNVHEGKMDSVEIALNSEPTFAAETSAEFSEPKSEVVDAKMARPDLKDPALSESIHDTSTPDTSTPDTSVAKPNKVSDRPIVYSYQLQSLSPSENTLIIDGDKLSRYTLKRTAPSEYVLRLPGATVAEGAQETMVAPQGSGAIRSVRSKESGDVLEVRIFTSPTENLEVRGSNGSLVVAAAASGFDFSDSRAQAKPELADAATKEVVVNGDGIQLASDEIDSEVSALLGEAPRYTGRLISLDLQDTDIDNALRIIAEVSNLNIIASEEVTGKITLRLVDVPWDQALDVILKTNGLDMIQENNVIRIAPVEKLRVERDSLKQARQAEEELEPLGVRYVRISYAKAAELKPLVEAVLSERGTVAYDERTNQLIVKDIRKGIVNVAELIAKLDLRTPQVLLETQIVESKRDLVRELGADFNFTSIQSPATGNATGYNFPNSIGITGSDTNGNFSSFGGGGSAVSFLLDSADGTKALSARLTALETEGRIKVVSRPSVATTNNKQAVIRSIEKIRIRAPDGGLSVATGAGAAANGTGAATEIIEIGIVLEVTPQASPDYYVLLDINAKSSNIGNERYDDIPNEFERSATSSVLVSSGQTFAMGGIYKTSDLNGNDGVPFLKDIPFLGHLFRLTTTRQSDEEILFFITPRIIEGSFDDAAMKAN